MGSGNQEEDSVEIEESDAGACETAPDDSEEVPQVDPNAEIPAPISGLFKSLCEVNVEDNNGVRLPLAIVDAYRKIWCKSAEISPCLLAPSTLKDFLGNADGNIMFYIVFNKGEYLFTLGNNQKVVKTKRVIRK
uniref:Uncharacterized protein n=1 Tax=Myoviridae sp. ctaOv25 TaxID=2827290 RepID=A0A8S5R535_9CAUD|nr:MAG TPA: hypothetical protein [Myoviridae sp. ctaOv25]